MGSPVARNRAKIRVDLTVCIRAMEPQMIQPVGFTPVQTGESEIVCAQVCGLGHYRMRGFYTIQTQADYDAWLAEQRFTQ